MAAREDTVTARGRRLTSSWQYGGSTRYAAGMVAALAYYYLVPNPVLALPGLAAFVALAWLRLEVALCLLPLTFPFWYVPKRVLGQAVFPLSEIALGVCLAVTIGHLVLAGIRITRNAEIAEDRRGRRETERIFTTEETEETEEKAEGEQRATAEHPEEHRAGKGVLNAGAPPDPISMFSANSAKLRVLRIFRSLVSPRWRWLLIGAALLLIGTAAGVLVAVRPREALRAFRWNVAEPLLYAGLLIALLGEGRAASGGAGARGGGASRDRGALIGNDLIMWLAGPLLALGALFGALAIAQVLWLHASFTPLAGGNHLVALPAEPNGPPVRATGIFYGSPNSLGALLERILPLALALLLWRLLGRGTGSSEDAEGRGDRREGKRVTAGVAEDRSSTSVPNSETESEKQRLSFSSSLISVPSVSSVVDLSATWGEGLLLGGCVLLMAVGLALTGSRGAEVGAAVGLLLVLLAHPRTRRVALGIVLLGVVVALWQSSALLRAALVGHGGSGEVRLLLWQSALHMIRDHPLLGIGPDQFLYYYDPAYTAHPYWIPRIGGRLTPAAFQPGLAHPHNLILDLWLSGGALGLAGFTLVVGWLAWSCWREWLTNHREWGGRWTARTALVVGAAGGVLAGLAHGMVDSAYFLPDLALLFWWAVAVVILTRTQTAAPVSSSEKLTGAARRGG